MMADIIILSRFSPFLCCCPVGSGPAFDSFPPWFPVLPMVDGVGDELRNGHNTRYSTLLTRSGTIGETKGYKLTASCIRYNSSGGE